MERDKVFQKYILYPTSFTQDIVSVTRAADHFLHTEISNDKIGGGFHDNRAYRFKRFVFVPKFEKRRH